MVGTSLLARRRRARHALRQRHPRRRRATTSATRSRRLLRAGRLRPADRPIPGRSADDLPDFENAGHRAAQGRRADLDWDLDDGRPTSRSAAATRAPTASSTPASGRSTSTRARTSPTARSTGTRQALARRLLRQLPRRRLGEPAHARHRRPAARLRASSTDTYNLDVSNTSVVGKRNILTYGGNFRTSKFDLEIAPAGRPTATSGASSSRTRSCSASSVRWLIGGRYDDIDPLEDGVFTPRTSLVFAPSAEPHVPRLVQRGVPHAVGDQQLPRRHDPQPARAVPAARPTPRQRVRSTRST